MVEGRVGGELIVLRTPAVGARGDLWPDIFGTQAHGAGGRVGLGLGSRVQGLRLSRRCISPKSPNPRLAAACQPGKIHRPRANFGAPCSQVKKPVFAPYRP